MVISKYHNVGGTLPGLIVERAPRMIDSVCRAVRMNRGPHRWAILTWSLPGFDANLFEAGTRARGIERLVDSRCRTISDTEIVVADIQAVFAIATSRRAHLYIRLI